LTDLDIWEKSDEEIIGEPCLHFVTARAKHRDVQQRTRQDGRHRPMNIFKLSSSDIVIKMGVPLVHEVVPMMEDLEHSLDSVWNQTHQRLPAVIRIAAKAALQVLGKYYALSDDSEVYRIAIVMCPDKKVQWFESNPDWRSEDAWEVKRIVMQRWTESYANLERALPKPTTTVAQQSVPKVFLVSSLIDHH
jgi:hypothetical protein